MSMNAPPLLTTKDVAHYCQVSVRTIRRWRRGGHLPAPLQIGGSLRWRAADLQEWLVCRNQDGITAAQTTGTMGD
ncbi:MAG: helix-turn-helix domain-containing protein [Planctomycetaceae bacterium]|nr:helix-turn-helix domain-containing protein [Planctomycetaceae bacterium]